jgi:CHAT domain-containing protein
MHHRPPLKERGKRKEERGKIFSLLSPLSYEPSYWRESTAYRRIAKSAINYIHLLIYLITLSACQTAMNSYLERQEISGMAYIL